MTDTEAFFSTPEAVSRLDLIRHLIENSELVPLVRGPSGSGKTLLAERLQSIAPINWVVCHFSADATMQPEHLLSHIARCSGLPLAESDNLSRIYGRFEQLRSQGSLPVLLVDDAESLPPTSLITLLRLYERQIDGAPLVSLVLFANEEIDKLLSTPQLQIMSPQAIQVIDLPVLTREESDGFMRYLFEREGLDDALLLDSNKLTRLYRETGGVPGQLATAILSSVGASEGAKHSSSVWIEHKSLIYRVLPVVVVLVALLLFQGPINSLFEPDDEKASPKVVEIDLPGENERLAIDTKKQVVDASRSDPVSGSESKLEYPQPASMQSSTEESKALAVPESSGDLTASQVIQASQPEKRGPEEGATSQAPVTTEIGETQESPTAAESKAEKVMDAATLETQSPPLLEGEQVPALAMTEMGNVKPESQATPSKASSGESPVSLEDGLTWVAAQPPGNFTLQLLAVRNLQSVQKFIKQHGLSGKVFTIKTERKGQPWYPLLWGSYPDRGTANAAAKQLPPAIQSAGFWVRTFASLRN